LAIPALARSRVRALPFSKVTLGRVASPFAAAVASTANRQMRPRSRFPHETGCRAPIDSDSTTWLAALKSIPFFLTAMKSSVSLLAAVLAIASIDCRAQAQSGSAAPDAIYYNGRVVTVDSSNSVREAFAVKDGRFVAVGSNADIRRLERKGVTTVHDLGGKMVLPGLIDSHVHAANASTAEFEHPIPPMETIQDVLDYIKERTKTVPEGGWISTSQFFITRLKEARFPTRAELDAVAPKHPVAFHTGPDVMVNSLALKVSGIDRNFKVQEGSNAIIFKDENGEPTGVLRGGAGGYLKKTSSKSKKMTEEDRVRMLTELLNNYNQTGFTAVADRGASGGNIAIYQKLMDAGKLTTRIALSHTIPGSGPIEGTFKAIDEIAAHPLRQDNGWLKIIGTKMWLDGGMLTGSAYMLKPWGKSEIYGIYDDEYRGVLNVPPDRLYQMVRHVASKGMQFTAHVQGDGAVTTLMDTYEKVNKEIPVRNLRMGLTHSSFMTKDTIERAARLGVVPDIQPIWLYLDVRILVKQFGYDRMRYFHPLKSLFEAGVIAGGGSDHMMKIGDLRAINPYNPFLGMWITITRQAKWYEGSFHPEECLTREQAIRYFSINNAHLLFWEKEIGSIEKGKRADFIQIDRDILKVPVDDIKDTKVLKTWLEGKVVFERAKS